MKLTDLVNQIFEDATARDQAHRLGLQSAGWGYWADKSGNKVARTVKGKLVRLSSAEKDAAEVPDGNVAQYRTRRTGPAYQEMPRENDMPNTVLAGKPQADLAYEPENPNAVYLTNRTPDWYANPGKNLLAKTRDLMWKSQSTSEFLQGMLRVFDVDPYVQVETNSTACDTIHPLLGTTAAGTYSSGERKIRMSSRASKNLRDFLKLGKSDLRSFLRKGPDSRDPESLAEWHRVLTAVDGYHTFIHELVHSKDAILKNDDGTYWPYTERDVPILEGLTEYKARRLVAQTLMGEESLPSWVSEYVGSYESYCKVFEQLTNLGQEDGINAMWAARDYVTRHRLLHRIVDKALLGVKVKAQEYALELAAEGKDYESNEVLQTTDKFFDMIFASFDRLIDHSSVGIMGALTNSDMSQMLNDVYKYQNVVQYKYHRDLLFDKTYEAASRIKRHVEQNI